MHHICEGSVSAIAAWTNFCPQPAMEEPLTAKQAFNLGTAIFAILAASLWFFSERITGLR
jgi:hypothetical protein